MLWCSTERARVFTDDILTAANYAKAGIPTMLHTQVANETDPNFDFCECNSGALRYPHHPRAAANAALFCVSG